MNHFANSLFTLLFGWARTITQQVWSSSSSGHFSGFFAWLGDHWMMLAVVLALIGTAVDVLVWLFRWKPYLVWKTRLRGLGRMLGGNGKTAAPNRRFEQGYKRGVELDMQEAPQEPAPEEWPEPVWPEDAPDATHSFTEQLLYDEALSDTALERQGRARQGEGDYEPPPMVTASWLSGAYQQSAAPAQRKRRSERMEKKKPAWTEKLMIREVEEDSLLDSLPPAVDRQKAFHDPVYPMRNYTGADTGWQPPVSGQSAEDGYKP